MPRYAANLSMLFTEHPLADRFQAARDAGFDAVEIQFPYEMAAESMAARLAEAGLLLVLHNLPAGDWAAGDRGIAVDPVRRDEFRAGVARALAYAEALSCPRLNCLAGIAPEGLDSDRARRTLLDNLRFAAEAVAAEGRQLLIEPINSIDVPGFWLNRAAQALDILDTLHDYPLQWQFDVYHMTRMGEDVPVLLDAHLERIGHIQIADAPGRHEPGSGGIPFDALFAQLDRIGYRGWVGCEYLPSTDTVSSLAWCLG